MSCSLKGFGSQAHNVGALIFRIGVGGGYYYSIIIKDYPGILAVISTDP